MYLDMWEEISSILFQILVKFRFLKKTEVFENFNFSQNKSIQAAVFEK